MNKRKRKASLSIKYVGLWKKVYSNIFWDNRSALTLMADMNPVLTNTEWAVQCAFTKPGFSECKHVEHQNETQHLEHKPVRVHVVSFPLAVLARWSGSHLFSLAPFTAVIREVRWLSAAGPPLLPPPTTDRAKHTELPKTNRTRTNRFSHMCTLCKLTNASTQLHLHHCGCRHKEDNLSEPRKGEQLAPGDYLNSLF